MVQSSKISSLSCGPPTPSCAQTAVLRTSAADRPAPPCPPTGARAETRARNREALYAASAELEKASAAVAAATAAGGKQQRKQEQPAQRADQPEQQEQPQHDKRKSRKQQQAAQQQAAQQMQAAQQAQVQQVAPMDAEPAPQNHAANGRAQQQDAAAPPSSSKKSKKRRQAEAEAQGAAASPLAVMPQTAGAPSGGGKKKKKSGLGAGSVAQRAEDEQHVGRQQLRDVPAAEQELLAAALATVTGDGAAAARSPSKKSVRFSLKRNLVNVIGQPPKPADVRTPPTAKPKGSALKKEGLIGGPASAPERLLTRAGVGRVARIQSCMNGRAEAATNGSASASKAEVGSGAKRSLLTRPRASDFF